MRAAPAELLVVFAFAALLAATPPAAASQPSVAPATASQPSVAPASSVVELLDQLSGAPDDAVATRVAAIEAAGGLAAAAEATAPADLAMLPDALFTAARACEERLHDPARALAIYERILARFPDARVAVAAGRRAQHLRAQIGQAGASVGEARAFSQLTFDGDRLPLDEALRRADELAARPWPGAAEVLLWSAELVRRRGELPEAMRRYRAVIDRSAGNLGGGAAATLATRGLAGAAVERGDWALAEQMARALPVEDPADTVTRDELLAKARIGRATSRWFWLARVVLVVSVLGLGLSLLQLAGWRGRAALRVVIRPPVEVAYMAPAAALMIGASFTGNVAITPAVVVISAGGMLLAWLSGATLSEAQRRQRDSRRRSLLHLGTCVLAALSLAYLAIVHTGLLELLISTVQLGPER
jgi:tetratricopeptide (TPR) repeat protein